MRRQKHLHFEKKDTPQMPFCRNPAKRLSKAFVFFPVSKQIPVVYSVEGIFSQDFHEQIHYFKIHPKQHLETINQI